MLSGLLCGSALPCRFAGGLGARAMAGFLFAGSAWCLAGRTRAAATAGCFGVEFAGLVLFADGSLGASLSAAGVWSSFFDPKRLRTKLSMLPEFPVEVGVPSWAHPASAIATATILNVRSARIEGKLGQNFGGTRASGDQPTISDSFGK